MVPANRRPRERWRSRNQRPPKPHPRSNADVPVEHRVRATAFTSAMLQARTAEADAVRPRNTIPIRRPACSPRVCCLACIGRPRTSVARTRPAADRHCRASGNACCHASAKGPPLRRHTPALLSSSVPLNGVPEKLRGNTQSRFREDRKMAKTPSNTENKTLTYAMLVVFTVSPNSDEHLHDQLAIRGEVQSWLEGLNAGVKGVCLRRAD